MFRFSLQAFLSSISLLSVHQMLWALPTDLHLSSLRVMQLPLLQLDHPTPQPSATCLMGYANPRATIKPCTLTLETIATSGRSFRSAILLLFFLSFFLSVCLVLVMRLSLSLEQRSCPLGQALHLAPPSRASPSIFFSKLHSASIP